MTSTQRTRYDAARILAVWSSNNSTTLTECANALGINSQPARRLARLAFVASLDAGNWRAQRGEAEAKLRTNWRTSDAR
jgi:predicted ArsR family transcriptional regulator